MKLQLKNLGKTQLWRLRQDVSLGSLFYNDYSNRYGIDKHIVCDFFDGYLDYLQELMEENNISDSEYRERLPEYDNKENLYNWFMCIEF